VFVTEENNAFTKKWPGLATKKQKKSLFYVEKSLVGID
jgi:hypothetical protein